MGVSLRRNELASLAWSSLLCSLIVVARPVARAWCNIPVTAHFLGLTESPPQEQ